LFKKDEMVCTKSLYNAVDARIIPVTDFDLPERLKRKHKKRKSIANKRVLGRSIDERPASVDSREEFGHWEIDTVVGKKDKTDCVVMTLLERQTYNYLAIEIPGKDSVSVLNAMAELRDEYGSWFNQVFCTITSDNGSEFSDLHLVENWGTTIYFAHPYSSWERSLNEYHNRMLRRFRLFLNVPYIIPAV